MIMEGDVVRVSTARPSEIRIGDVVAFQSGQRVLVHRVIGKSVLNQQIIFRHMGDAGTSSATVAARNLIGRVSAVKKNGHEISLDRSWYTIGNQILAWRLRLKDSLGRQHRPIGVGLRFVLRPVWKLSRSLLFWRL